MSGARMLALVHDAFGGRGGIAKFNRDLLGALAAHPAVAEVVALPRRCPDPSGPLPAGVTWRPEAAGSRTRYGGAVLATLAARGGFDLVVAGHLNMLPFAVACRARYRAPIALVVHGIDAWARRGALARRALREVGLVLAVSRLTRARFLAWSPTPPAAVAVLPNAFDPGRFAPGPPPAALVRRYGLAGRTVLLTLGQLTSEARRKGFDEVLEALPALAESIPALTYVIAGEGPDRPRLAAKARALGVADRVVFTGWVAEEEKADHYRLADAFALPSRGEGFGIVLLEAMACGIPVVASARDGGRDAVRDGALGVLVDPADPPSVRAGIARALARGRGVPPPGLAHFTVERFVARVHALVDAQLGERGARQAPLAAGRAA